MDFATYLPIENMKSLKEILNEKLEEYNETHVQMNLVLFDQAVEHVVRIARIINRPAGNALLIGVGGSGKQSLSRLAAYLLGHKVDTIAVTSNFNVQDFKEQIGEIFKKCTKPPADISRVLLVTDTQLSNEEILISINDILNSGVIPGLDIDGHLNSLKNVARGKGYGDNIKQYFVDKLRENMHICLAMSPVGDNLRIKARKFPGLVN